LLDKFNVVDHHLVIATQLFEPQKGLLICLAEIDGLGFYNAGPAAEAVSVTNIYNDPTPTEPHCQSSRC